jgi:MFS transporter, ACS family, tartrate transporter
MNLSAPPTELDAAERRLVHRAAWRILPLMMAAFLVSFIDRVNIGFAAFQMDQAVHLTPAIFGLGGGLYFISYVLCEVPSNLLVTRYGVRLFLTRIMVGWGLVTCAMALVQGTWSFLTLRLLLGAAEAGLFPAVILYLTFWFPRSFRATVIGWFTVAAPLSGVLGSPISAALLRLDKLLGIAGWQWLFIVEGLPAVLLGITCYLTIADGPARAHWLSPAERATYTAMLAREEAPRRQGREVAIWRALTNPTVLGLAVVLAASSAVSAAYAVWTPRFIRSFGLDDTAVGWLNAVPYFAGAAALLLTAYSSDRQHERIWHTAIPLLLSTVCTLLLLVSGSFGLSYLLVGLSIVGIYASKAPTWSVGTEWLPAEMKAIGIAQVNAVSSLISFFPVYIVGLIRGSGGSFALAFAPMALISASGVVLLLAMSARRTGRLAHAAR